MIYYTFLRNSAVQCKYILRININLFQEQFVQLVEAAVIRLCQWIVFIQVEYYNIAEAHTFFLMSANQFRKQRAK